MSSVNGYRMGLHRDLNDKLIVTFCSDEMEWKKSMLKRFLQNNINSIFEEDDYLEFLSEVEFRKDIKQSGYYSYNNKKITININNDYDIWIYDMMIYHELIHAYDAKNNTNLIPDNIDVYKYISELRAIIKSYSYVYKKYSFDEDVINKITDNIMNSFKYNILTTKIICESRANAFKQVKANDEESRIKLLQCINKALNDITFKETGYENDELYRYCNFASYMYLSKIVFKGVKEIEEDINENYKDIVGVIEGIEDKFTINNFSGLVECFNKLHYGVNTV